MESKLIRRCLTEKEAAYYIGMSPSFLQRYRYEGKIGNRTIGPRHVKLGKCIRYLKDDLDRWLEGGDHITKNF